MRLNCVLACIVACISVGAASVRGEDWKPVPRSLPPKGIELPQAQREKIEAELKKLSGRLAPLAARADASDILADAAVYEKAVRFALADDEFYAEKDAAVALDQIATANKRLDSIERNQQPWATQHGLLVRGCRSAIDGSVQPYGLEIPEGLDSSRPVPLYVWLHGRGDKETDLHFIRGRETHKGQIQPKGAIVLHPFGRQCLGFKSAGEVDVFEAIASVQSRYKIDPDRIVLMGFSMGGAGAWHIGAHYADRFCAVHAGAGFVDVARYQHLKPADYPPSYEQTLWGLYDVPDYVRNLFNVPTVGYGGEIDPQRASSEIMAEAFKAEGREMVRIVGPKMPHKYDPASLAEIMRRMNEAVMNGRNGRPDELSLQTRTLRYNRMFWAELTGLAEHWQDSRLDAKVPDERHIELTTKNATRLTLHSPWTPSASPDRQVAVKIDGAAPISIPADFLDAAGGVSFAKAGAGWAMAGNDDAATLRKRPGLQGPIDDAFMGPFLVVMPTGESASPAVRKWVAFEEDHLARRWRQVFRGELRTKSDTAVTPDDMARYNLVLWGDAKSNRVIAQLAGKLPIPWTNVELAIGGKKFDAATHLPLAIYPNPLSPSRYVVLNSGPTFREASDRTNSLQNPKLPDWAIVDVTVAPDGSTPGKVEEAGFFDEQWRVK